jgi:hypothetical protein
MREKGKKRAFLELPILVDEPKRTFLERVWPVSGEERKAIKVSQDVPEESKFSLLSEEETTRVPLFKPSKIKDIDAYVETRKIVAKTSTLPSFMLPVEENYPIRYNTTTVAVPGSSGRSGECERGAEFPLTSPVTVVVLYRIG